MKKNQQVFIICRGLPASGKTTYAKLWVDEDPDNRVRIEKDEIRKNQSLFKGGEYNHKRGDESIVIRERDNLLHSALSRGKSVISSDTNLVQRHVAQMSGIARKYNIEPTIKKFMDVPLSELIERDSRRPHSVGENVIRKMFHEHVKTLPTFLAYDPELPYAVVSDLDGTLTTGPKNRSPYEWSKVGNDDINLGVAHLLDGVKAINYAKVLIFSGRDAVCRPETEEWLERQCIDYDELHMRTEGDSRGDDIVKSEMIEKHIKGRYNVLIWFDDRVRVANMLRDTYGINVAQLGDPNFKF